MLKDTNHVSDLVTLLKDTKWVCDQASKRTDVGGINPEDGGGANVRNDQAKLQSDHLWTCKGLHGWEVQPTEAAWGEAFPQQVFELRNENNASGKNNCHSGVTSLFKMASSEADRLRSSASGQPFLAEPGNCLKN